MGKEEEQQLDLPIFRYGQPRQEQPHQGGWVGGCVEYYVSDRGGVLETSP
jgi:hypothetical protein